MYMKIKVRINERVLRGRLRQALIDQDTATYYERGVRASDEILDKLMDDLIKNSNDMYFRGTTE